MASELWIPAVSVGASFATLAFEEPLVHGFIVLAYDTLPGSFDIRRLMVASPEEILAAWANSPLAATRFSRRATCLYSTIVPRTFDSPPSHDGFGMVMP